ncbi:HupE / UreJ protein [Paenibacillus sophorae]|uniref:HupE / UreJ protein n=1 Tax=Paenibacillus sophorae TaxID=1333845 RepID=A0A1H8RNL6_9BACL|nr:HupE/UreJ family protein [Paenibacillus sophorae]QWU17060.1 HupE/UreJ family protein [Paenibacillus sophorae]SEO67563.1 HupE / UreJ protein [Paenibacillus sophorae]
MNIKWGRRLAVFFSMLGFIFALGAPVSLAHGNNSLAYSDISAGDGFIKYVLQIDMYDLRAAATPNDPDIGLSTPEVLERFATGSRTEVEQYLLSHTSLYADSLPLEGKLTDLRIIQKENEPQPFAEAVITYPVDRVPKSFFLHYDLVFDSDQWHINYVTVTLGDLKKEAVIVNELKDIQVGGTSLNDTASHFVQLGIGRLLKGIESLLFIMLLLTGCRSLKQSLAATAVFAAAISLSLALTALGITEMPASFTVSILPLSLICAALILLLNLSSFKLLITLAGLFGLMHGFGFAVTLYGLRADDGYFAASWTAFIVGIGAGLVIAAAVWYTAILLLRKIGRSVPALQAAAGLFGLIVFIIKAYA